jgi:hypothetical protein
MRDFTRDEATQRAFAEAVSANQDSALADLEGVDLSPFVVTVRSSRTCKHSKSRSSEGSLQKAKRDSVHARFGIPLICFRA